jgi:hypothetical protein
MARGARDYINLSDVFGFKIQSYLTLRAKVMEYNRSRFVYPCRVDAATAAEIVCNSNQHKIEETPGK